MKTIKIVGAVVDEDGKKVTIQLKNAPKDYKYIFLDADDLIDIAHFAGHL